MCQSTPHGRSHGCSLVAPQGRPVQSRKIFATSQLICADVQGQAEKSTKLLGPSSTFCVEYIEYGVKTSKPRLVLKANADKRTRLRPAFLICQPHLTSPAAALSPPAGGLRLGTVWVGRLPRSLLLGGLFEAFEPTVEV